MAKIVKLKEKVDKEYIRRCPECNCTFSFLESEFKFQHFWHVRKTIKCPNCKKYINELKLPEGVSIPLPPGAR